MSSFSNDFKDEVKDRIDIVDVVSDYVVLKKSGKNYKGLCPFHQEKTPSFTVNPANQFYHCFGCGAGGDVFSFLMDIEHITFFESLKMAAERVGLDLPNQSKEQKQVSNLRDKIFEINNLSARFYNYLLLNHKTGKKALNYLKNRGFTKKDIKEFSLGFAPDKWTALYKFLSNKGYSKENMIKAGLLIKKSRQKFYDRFRNRIIFPIFNSRGEVLAFGGRIIDDEINQPKYLNSPDTMVYDKSDNLYGLNWAKYPMRKEDDAIIMEGYTDVLTAHIYNIKNTVASLGTSLTQKQARLLKRYVSKVYIAYDSDTAGAKATLRGLDILKKEGLNLRVIKLPEDTDPDDYLKEKGKNAFLELKENALSFIEFKVENVITRTNINDADDKVNISHEIIDILAEINDPIERDVYSHDIANKINVDGDLLLQEVEKKYKNNSNTQDKITKNRYTKNGNNVNKTNSLKSINEIERKLIKIYIDYPEYRPLIKNNINLDYLLSKKAKKIIKKLFLLSQNENINNLLSKFDNENIKDIMMKLIVEEKIEIDEAMIKGYLNKLIENYRYRYKFYLYQKLQNKELDLQELNSILFTYQKLFCEEKKGGI